MRSLHLFGRNRSRADTVLENADASQIHASVRWDGQGWLLVDHSRHGTFIDRQALPAAGSAALSLGATIQFASGAQQSWTVTNLDSPRALLVPANPRQAPISLHQLHCLPNEEAPQGTVYLDREGRWLWEHDGVSQVLHDGAVVCVGQQSWRYFNGMAIESTALVEPCGARAQPPARFHFDVSQNEEHVQLSLQTGHGQVDLGERSHHYALLLLARQRLQDARRGYDPRSQGWLGTEQLADMLGLESKHLNMQLHRARHQINQAAPTEGCWDKFIERRRGELRFGSFSFQIMLGSRLEAQFDPSGAIAD